ncbi:MAG: hypothetical protein HFJ54_06435 [Clostridia bacterium]|nr:hypothetical protein [Clostridia bacterium]
MSIKKDLKRDGIEVINEIDTLTQNTLSKRIADTISKNFPQLGLNSKELFINISRLNMYFAKLPNGISAKYFYKNKSIYFDYSLETHELTDVAIHECIHYLQEKCDKNGDILRLGLCDYTSGDLPGIGINEAAVQLMAAKCINNGFETEKYFGIEIQTNTATYYPLECALVNQMAYVIGENVLFDSTINANNRFKEEFISFTSAKTYYIIQKNIEMLMENQARLEELYSNLQNYDTDSYGVQRCTKEIDKQKGKIRKIFLNTQRLILTSYFDNAINLAYSPKQIENYRNKLYLFKNILGQVEGDNFYNDYYIDKMVELENRYELRKGEITDLVIVRHNFISKLVRKIKLLFGFNPDYAKIRNKI